MKLKWILLWVAAALFSSGCHKQKSNTVLEQFFEDNILNQTFTITYASDESVDITTVYSGYDFVLKKGSDYYHGALVVTKNSTTYNGSWSSNEDYSKLKIVLPTPPAEFLFLVRDWRFTSKNLPELKFAPWGSNAAIALTMKRK